MILQFQVQVYALVSSAEARKAMGELKSEQALAILAPANINNVGEELHVMVEGAGGDVGKSAVGFYFSLALFH